jgi:P27 family predicted phage terminase small subunit
MNDDNKEADILADSNAESLLALCPTELGTVARNEFARVVAELRKLKLAKPLDLALVALYSNAYAGWLAAVAAIEEYGPVLKSASGYPSQSPYVTLANQHAATLMRCGADLCLSPASRIKNLPERKSLSWENSDGSPVK